VGSAYQIPDVLWEAFQPILAELEAQKPPKKKAGRPRMEDRQALSAIFYVLLTGGQWGALPRSLGAKSTVHDRLKEWQQAGVFERLWKLALEYYDQERGIEWEWQACDGAMTKAPLGGEKHG
jgi:transposase